MIVDSQETMNTKTTEQQFDGKCLVIYWLIFRSKNTDYVFITNSHILILE